MSIDKIVLPHRFPSEPTATLVTDSTSLMKTAFSTNDELRAFMVDFRHKPDHGYILINAMGAHEAWNFNNNMDGWFTSELIPARQNPNRPSGLKTFETHARVYRHHNNKAGSPVFGSIPKSFWNARMLRVELLLELPVDLNAKELADAEAGRDVAFSMGVRVTHDQCSICGHNAPTRKEYCGHLKTQLGQVWPDGRVCGMMNFGNQFMDLSIVSIPADKTAYNLMTVNPADFKLSKVASDSEQIMADIDMGGEYSAMIYSQTVLKGRDNVSYLMGKYAEYPESVKMAAIAFSPIKRASQRKTADIDKLVPLEPLAAGGLHELYDRFLKKGFGRLRAEEPEMDSGHVDELHDAFGGNTKSLMSTLAAYGVVLKPKEYQRLMLGIMGKQDERSALDETGESILDVSPKLHPGDVNSFDYRDINHENAEALEDLIAAKSYHRGSMLERARSFLKEHEESETPADEAKESPGWQHMEDVLGTEEREHLENPLLSRLGGGFEDYAKKSTAFARQVAAAAEHVFGPGTKLTGRLGITPCDGASAMGLPMVALGASTKEAAAAVEKVYGNLTPDRIKTAASAMKKTAELPFPVVDGIILEILS